MYKPSSATMAGRKTYIEDTNEEYEDRIQSYLNTCVTSAARIEELETKNKILEKRINELEEAVQSIRDFNA